MPPPPAAGPAGAVLRLVVELGDPPAAHELIRALRALTHVYEVGMLAAAARPGSRFHDDALTRLRIAQRAGPSPSGHADRERLAELARERYEHSANEIVWANPLRVTALVMHSPLDVTLTQSAVGEPWSGYGSTALSALAGSLRQMEEHVPGPDLRPGERFPRRRARDEFLRRIAEDGFWQRFSSDAAHLVLPADRAKLENSLMYLGRRRPRLLPTHDS